MTQLAANSLKPSESVRNLWNAKAEHGTPMSAMLEPGYWAHVSAKLREGDHIHVLAQDRSFHAAFLVLDVGKLYAKVVKIPGLCFEITPAQVLNIEIPKGYDVKFRGEEKKWCVLRGKDVLKEGLDKSAAETWLTDHLKAVA